MSYAGGKGWTLHLGDCLQVLPTLPEASVDAVVTDPPYELGFMGKAWDASGIAYRVELWAQVLRVLKPGGHLLAFGGTRTYHRMACAIEDAGFEIRDSLHWIYGTGFPKSLDVSKAIDREAGVPRAVVGVNAAALRPNRARAGMLDQGGGGTFAADNGATITAPSTDAAKQWAGWGTALKPGHEPIVLARKPLVGTVAANVQRFGTGALNVDACRIEGGGYTQEEWDQKSLARTSGMAYGTHKPSANPVPSGRWPANVLLDEDAAAELDAQSGERTSGAPGIRRKPHETGSMSGRLGLTGERETGHADSGGASRFFKVISCDESASDAASNSRGARHRADDSAPGAARRGLSSEQRILFPSTSETASGSERSDGSDTPPIRNTGAACSPELPHARPTPSESPVPDVERQTPTDITRITADPSTSSGCADAATSGSMWRPPDPGAPGFVPFRYVAKPSRVERDMGLHDLEPTTAGEATDREDGSDGLNSPRAGAGRTGGARNHHPTVKPVELMRYLVRLVTPPKGVVLDPFLGSGTTAAAAWLEFRDFIGIELSADYLEIAKRRAVAREAQGELFQEATG